MNRKFLLLAIVLYFAALILGVINLINNNFNGISWIFSPLGIFIWGDALIVAPFMIFGSGWLYFKNKAVWSGLFFSSFFTLRWFFETLYSMLAQFSSEVRPWEIEWRSLSIVKSLGVIDTLVIFQLIYTSLTVISGLFLIYFIKKFLKSS